MKHWFWLIITGSPSFTKKMGGWGPVSSQKKVGGGGVNFSPKKGEVGKIVEGGC